MIGASASSRTISWRSATAAAWNLSSAPSPRLPARTPAGGGVSHAAGDLGLLLVEGRLGLSLLGPEAVTQLDLLLVGRAPTHTQRAARAFVLADHVALGGCQLLVLGVEALGQVDHFWVVDDGG